MHKLTFTIESGADPDDVAFIMSTFAKTLPEAAPYDGVGIGVGHTGTDVTVFAHAEEHGSPVICAEVYDFGGMGGYSESFYVARRADGKKLYMDQDGNVF